MSFTYTFWPVAPALASLVDQIYVFRCNEARFDVPAGALLPQLLWQIGGRLSLFPSGGQETPCFTTSLLGPSAAALRLTSEGATVVIGVGMFPEGWHALVEASADTMIGRLLDLHEIWGDDALTPLAGRPDDTDKALAARVEALLLRRIENSPPCDLRIAAISRWINGPVTDIKLLAAELAVSERQLARIARRAHGLPPRLLANKHRVLKAAAMLAAGMADTKDSWTADFADQSHFTREFRRFMGITPAAFLQRDGALVREVMRVRREIASEHPLGLA